MCFHHKGRVDHERVTSHNLPQYIVLWVTFLRRVRLALVLVAMISLSVQADESGASKANFCGTVIGVPSGNHLIIEDAQKRTAMVRLAWIFAPEDPQPNGVAARIRLDRLAYNRVGCVKVIARYPRRDGDPRERYYGTVQIKDVGDLGLSMLRIGMAWHYVDYARRGQPANEFAQYAKAESEARSKGLGLWADPNAIAPWLFKGKNIRVR